MSESLRKKLLTPFFFSALRVRDNVLDDIEKIETRQKNGGINK